MPTDETPREPVLVVLAAGASRRLGATKALVELGEGPDSTPLARLLEAGAAFAPEGRCVVSGADRAAIGRALPPGVVHFHNARWAQGRTGSIALAHGRLPGRDLCLAPVDVPLVSAGVFRALGEAWRRVGRPAGGWLAPWVEVAGERTHGHPIVVGRGLLQELERWPADRPLRELRELADPLLDVRVEDAAILDDLDGPEDLERLRARLA